MVGVSSKQCISSSEELKTPHTKLHVGSPGKFKFHVPKLASEGLCGTGCGSAEQIV